MIASSEALVVFQRLLEEAGFDATAPDPERAWAAFKAFAAVPVACAEDLLLFQCGTFDFTGRERFELGFVRQFSYEDGAGEYAGMEQLHCTIYYEPVPELRALATTLWSAACGSLAEFFACVETLPEFRVPVQGHAAVAAEIYLEEV